MARSLASKQTRSSYEEDFFDWTSHQSESLRDRRVGDLDWDNLAEEVESLGRSQKLEIRSRLRVLLAHLLKWHFQPNRRSHSWQSTIGEQRVHITGIVEASPSLRRYPAETLAWAYTWARTKAQSETGLPLALFPEACPYEVDAVLRDDFLPGPAWQPSDLVRD